MSFANAITSSLQVAKRAGKMQRQQSNHAIKQKKAEFRKAKRRLSLGVGKANDVTNLTRLSKELGYTKGV